MRVGKIADTELRVANQGVAQLQTSTFTFPVAGESGALLSGVVCHRKDGRATYYYPEETAKERIVLHFTAGNLLGDLVTLTGEQHVSTPYVIARNGTIYQLFSPKHWSYHLGRGSIGGNTNQSKATIGIEISNYGPLTRNGDQLETIYSKPGRPDVYSTIGETDAYIKTETPFRDYSYFASYTDEQYDSLIKLLRHLTSEFGIAREFLDPALRYQPYDNITGFSGIVSHVNYRRSGKWDIGPAFDWERVIAGVQAATYSDSSGLDAQIRNTQDALAEAKQQLYNLETRIIDLENKLSELEREKSSSARSALPTARILSNVMADEVFDGDVPTEADYGPDGPETGYDPTLLDLESTKVMDTIRITEQELKRLFSSADPDPELVDMYFETSFDGPFEGYLQLKSNVEVVPASGETGERGMVQNLIVSLANNLSRSSRTKKYKRRIRENPDSVRMISEGDSWFQHPHPKLLDTIDQLLNHYAILSLGAAGDTVRNMFYEGEYLKAIRDENPRIFLLSGGGNDILGEQFRGFLQDEFDPGEPGENPERFLKDKFYAELESIGEVYTRIFDRLKSQNIDILIHGYDYVIPLESTNKGWLGRYMIEKGISDQVDRVAIIRYLIDQFNAMLVKRSEGYDKVHYLDLRNTVRDDQWYDEIHPTSDGYQDVAFRFHEKIESILNQ